MTLDEIKEESRLLMRANEANPDPNTSQAVATSIMLALLARSRTGRGQAIEVTMLQANAWANADEAYDYTGRPPTQLPDEQCYGLGALYRLYRASEGRLFLACPFEREWQALCGALKKPDWASDERFSSSMARVDTRRSWLRRSQKSLPRERPIIGKSFSLVWELPVYEPTAMSEVFSRSIRRRPRIRW